MSTKVGLITRDGSGNVLLDTTTAMFRLLGVLHIRWKWSTNGGATFHDATGSYTNPGLLLGTPFFFARPINFKLVNPLDNGLLISATGDVASWSFDSYYPGSDPYYVDITYGVRS